MPSDEYYCSTLILNHLMVATQRGRMTGSPEEKTETKGGNLCSLPELNPSIKAAAVMVFLGRAGSSGRLARMC